MTNKINYDVDVLAFAAHPDDIELSAGGTIAKLTSEGKTVAMVDFTRGELGTRGTGEIRKKEAEDSSKILGVSFRENLDQPDGSLIENEESVLKTITMIRKYRPNVVIMNSPFDRHPDHENAHRIVRTAMFKSGLVKISTEFDGIQQEPHRIRKMFAYMQSYEFERKPDFYIDITTTFEKKMEAISAFVSQVWVPGKSDPGGRVTRLSRPEFLEEIKARAIYAGTQVGFRFAEPFYSVEPVGLNSISVFL